MKSIKEIEGLEGKIVLLRADFNVPVGDDGIVDADEDLRILRTIPTINFLKDSGAKVIILSHTDEESGTLLPIYEYLKKYFDLGFALTIEDAANLIKENQIVLLENIRKYKGEKENDEAFTRELSALGSIYVNDAFSVCHREHASIVGLPKVLPAYAGLGLLSEVENLSRVINNPDRPFVAIIGGAKLESKKPTVLKMLSLADVVLVGGRIGLDWKDEIPSNLFLPVDYAENNLDIGSETIKKFTDIILKAKTVLWAGPMGNFEKPPFDEGTRAVADAIVKSGAYSVAGGGDSIKALSEFGLIENFSFVSTAGSAMLEFLVDGSLPGIDALN